MARAPSLPGRGRSQRSAEAARPARRGSITISLAPRFFASRAAVAWASQEVAGLKPHSRMQPVFS
jgi:hypothetical protein